MKYDSEFLQQLDKIRFRTTYVRLILLNFADEKPLKEIQGTVSAGSISVNASSPIRRTLNLTMTASSGRNIIPYVGKNNALENLDNEISANKKIKVEIGLANPHLKSWPQYDDYDILWFPQGVYIVSTTNSSRSTNGWNISITAKDKMCLLDGSVGGMLPASVTFHESYIEHDNGDITIQQPTIFQIIYEAVKHWGGEKAENIIISDVDDQIKLLTKYIGDNPIYFFNEYASFSFNQPSKYEDMKEQGEDVGYRLTDFTYPGDLILSAGETVQSLLDKIKNVLGNYEYFYNLEGQFVFQQIKNYLNTPSPLTELNPENYIKSYNNQKAEYSLTDLDSTTAITISPNYPNLKNDFYVWGKRKTANGAELPIRYHLAIDSKPRLNLAKKYMWEIKDKKTSQIIRYDFLDEESNKPAAVGYQATLISIPCDEWREELYRRALVARINDGQDDAWYRDQEDLYDNLIETNYYDMELLAEWRKLYDPMNKEWNNTNHWNPNVTNNPGLLDYWLDFIDSATTSLGKYSIKSIGRRTKVVNNDKIKSIRNKEVPDIIFVDTDTPLTEEQKIKFKAEGQKYFQLQPQYSDLFVSSSTSSSCLDEIREMLYQNLNYNTAISITCIPRYYLEPNTIIYVEDIDSNIKGNYQITQFNLPLTYNGTMSISATEILTRV